MKTKLIAQAGLFSGLILVTLLIASFSPVNKLSISALSAILVQVFADRHTLKTTLFLVAATSLLSFMLLPYKMIAILYMSVFGGYVLIRKLLKTDKIILKKCVLLVYMDTVVFILFFAADKIFENIFQKILNRPLWQIITFFFVLQLAILIYDYMLSVVSCLIERYLRKIGI